MSVNISVKLNPNESSERLIKRFLKKCKRLDIVKEYIEKTSFHKTKSEKKRIKIEKNKFFKEKQKNKRKKP